jgi:tripartite-type tricarboxylate transporter receptor subunit TctC
MFQRLTLLSSLLTSIFFTATNVAHAQAYATQPIKMVVAFPAGGTTDLLARVFSRKMSELLNQPVTVENRTGAGGIIGTEFVARAAPDGQVIMLGTVGTMSVNQSLYKKLPYDVEKDFVPVTLLATLPNILLINPTLPYKNIKELIIFAKANPGKLTYASAGTGTASFLAGEMFKQEAGVEITHVPYRGSAPALNDLMAGHVSISFDYPPSSLPFITSGKLKALGVTSLTRVKVTPDVPTLNEDGLPGFNLLTWYGVFAPKGTSSDIVNKLQSTMAEAAKAPDVIKRMEELAVDMVVNSPAEFTKFHRADVANWAKFIQDKNIKIDE